MYIQPAGRSPYTVSENEAVVLPEGYRGNAFDRTPPAEEPKSPPDAEAPAVEAVAEAVREAPAEDAEAAPVGGLLGRMPLLSSLLPPRRSGRKEGGSDLLVLGVLFLLLREEGDGDLLPLLLLLLFWN